MNRLYVVETDADVTGATADHRLPLRAERRSKRSRARSPRRVGVGGAAARHGAGRAGDAVASAPSPRTCRRTAAAAVVIAGDAPAAGGPRARARDQRGARQRRQDGRLHADRSKPSRSISSQSLRELVADMDAGKVDAARHPRRQPGLHRAGRSRVRRRAEQGAAPRPPRPVRRRDRRRCATGTSPRRTTSRRGATRARSTARSSIVQPLIAPLYGGKSAHEAARRAARRRRTRPRYDVVRDVLAGPTGRAATEFDDVWRQLAARRRRRRHGVRAAAASGARGRRSARDRRRGRSRRRRSRSSSGPTRRSATAASPTTAGCRNCRSRSRKLTWDNAALRQPGDRRAPRHRDSRRATQRPATSSS